MSNANATDGRPLTEAEQAIIGQAIIGAVLGFLRNGAAGATRAGDDAGDRAGDDRADADGDQASDDETGRARPAAPLYRSKLTLTVPSIDNERAQALTLDLLICHEEIPGVMPWYGSPESHEAGWRTWGFGPIEVAVRIVGD